MSLKGSVSAKRFAKKHSKFQLYPSQKKAVTAIVKKQINNDVETKFHEERYTTNPDNSALSANQLFRITNIAQGQTDSTRIGDEVKPTSIRVRIASQTNLADPELAVLRAVLFQWHPDSVRDPPSFDEILMTPSLATVYAPQSELNHDQRKQFSVLADQMWTINKNGAENAIHLNTLKSRKMRKLQFRNASQDGNEHIYLLIVSDRNILSAEPIVRVSARVNYTDM